MFGSWQFVNFIQQTHLNYQRLLMNHVHQSTIHIGLACLDNLIFIFRQNITVFYYQQIETDTHTHTDTCLHMSISSNQFWELIHRIKSSPLLYIKSTFYQSIVHIHLSFWFFFPCPRPILLFALLQTTLRCACLPVSSVLFSPLLLSKGGSSTDLLYIAVISSACLY